MIFFFIWAFFYVPFQLKAENCDRIMQNQQLHSSHTFMDELFFILFSFS